MTSIAQLLTAKDRLIEKVLFCLQKWSALADDFRTFLLGAETFELAILEV